ncbi:hypothetical protein FO519_004272 [Halicephalobus sp. NKZ332]|nr:hypothetical protein FO519_004272 [Halicephalobus sp. NKZ332]
MIPSCVQCGVNVQHLDQDDSDLMRALKEASRTENTSHAYNLLDLFNEHSLRSPLCYSCNLNALSEMKKELTEIGQETNAYEFALRDLAKDKECQPYCPGPMKRKLSDLSLEELMLEQELLSLEVQEELLCDDIASQIKVEHQLREEEEYLARERRRCQREFVENLEAWNGIHTQSKYYNSSTKTLQCEDVINRISSSFPPPVYSEKK